MTLSLVTAPVGLPLDISDTKVHLRVNEDDTIDDSLIGLLIEAAGQRAELATQRALLTQTWDLTLDDVPSEDILELPKPPLVSVTSITYFDTAGVSQTWASSNYVVQAYGGPRCRRGRIVLPDGGSWPITLSQPGAMTVRFVSGYGKWQNIPALVRAGMLLDVGTLYANREGVTKGQMAELPMGVRAIYWSYKSHRRGAA